DGHAALALPDRPQGSAAAELPPPPGRREGADESQAQAALDQALALRATMHRVFLAIAVGNDPEPVDLERLRHAYTDAMSEAILVATEERFAWDWPSDAPHLEQPLWPVVRSAIRLLTQGDLSRIKVCENPYGCGWLFYDSSKNGSRRWCSMEGCGSQIKMRRQYAKRRATAAA
ncbi:MAG TPA: CGNR zinc finger domain-containing protein, partial [Thermomicrobiales bacterium]|nr:CGNR zinc finger domain-containing protein [Thermomicrobiales bacterium]